MSLFNKLGDKLGVLTLVAAQWLASHGPPRCREQLGIAPAIRYKQLPEILRKAEPLVYQVQLCILETVIYLDRSLFDVNGRSRSALAVDLLVSWSGFRDFGAPRAPVLYLI